MINMASSDGSDHSDGGDSQSSPEKEDSVCRDFLRNVCKRGLRCKYRHPSPNEAKELGRHHEYTFCHDFQNSGCRRAICKFIHCTREEEEYYKQTGQLPVRLQQAAALGIGVAPNELPLLKGEIPVCKDFLKGDCKRGARCKYRHLAPTEFEYELQRPERSNTTIVKSEPPTSEPSYATDDHFITDNGFDYDPLPKRRKMEVEVNYYHNTQTFTHIAPPGNAVAPAPIAAPAQAAVALAATNPFTNAIYRQPDTSRLLEEENALLRRKVEELKKQVSDLAATNEVLLEMNARYRSNRLTALTAGSPVVSVSQVLTSSLASAPIVARAGMVGQLPTLTFNAANELVMSSHSTLSQELTQGANQPGTITHGSVALPVTLSMESVSATIPVVRPAPQQRTTIQPAAVVASISSLPVGPPPGSIPSLAARPSAPGVLTQAALTQPPPTMQVPSSISQPLAAALPPTTLSAGVERLIPGSAAAPLVSYPIRAHAQLPNSSLGTHS